MNSSGSTINGSAIDNMLLPIGGIFIYPLGAIPVTNGLARCEGQALSRTTYAQLFSLIGTSYGAGDGTTTFNIPDYRGLFLRGAGTNGTTAGKLPSGAQAAGPNVGFTQAPAIAKHGHAYYFGGSGPSNSNNNMGPSTGFASQYSQTPSRITVFTGNDIYNGGANTTNGAPSQSGTDETRPINIGVVYVMRVL